jgi:hypothetical protein
MFALGLNCFRSGALLYCLFYLTHPLFVGEEEPVWWCAVYVCMYDGVVVQYKVINLAIDFLVFCSSSQKAKIEFTNSKKKRKRKIQNTKLLVF